VLYMPKDVLKSQSAKTTLLSTLRETRRRFLPNTLPLLDLDVDSDEFRTLLSMKERIAVLRAQHSLNGNPQASEWLDGKAAQAAVEAECATLENDIKQAKQLPLKDELRKMKTVLRRLGHTDQDNIVQLKGTVACVISTCDELLATELLLGGAFNAFDPAVCAALVSCMAFNEPGDDAEAPTRPELQAAYKAVQDAARRIAEVQRDAGCDVDVEKYVKSFRPDLMEVVLLWARGAKFREVCDVTKVFEGTIVRAVRREVELLRQLTSACKVVGDDQLEKKFAQSIQMMQRGIMFAASLYL